MIRTIYLAGPIAGCTKGEANDWRDYVRSKLEPHRIRGISPLRCEPIIGNTYDLPGSMQHTDPKFGTARAISSKNMFDVRNTDLTLAFLPKFMNEKRPSVGTILEIGWAKAFNKPVVLVTDDDYYRQHPVSSFCASWLLDNLDDACDTILGVMGEYVRPFRE